MNWVEMKLGEVCTVKRGTTITQKDAVFGEIPVVAGGLKPTYYHNEANRFNSTVSISGSGANAGFVNLWRQPIFASDCSTVETKDSNLDIIFVYYFLLSKQDFIYKNLRSGAAQPHVYGKDIADITIPIPPLSTQLNIVHRIDAIFSEIQKAMVAAEGNYKNSEALFQSYLNEVFQKDSKNLIKLKDCCEIKPPKSETKVLEKTMNVSFLPMEALGINEKYAVANQTRTLESVSGSYTYFAEGDVLLAKITPCFENGKLGIAKNLVNKIGFGSSEYIVFRPNKDVSNEWLYYFLNRQNFRIDGARHMAGAVGHKRVTKEFIENLLLPVPPLEEQRNLIATIENVFESTQKLMLSTQNKKIELTNLKLSILKQAFSGELIKE